MSIKINSLADFKRVMAAHKGKSVQAFNHWFKTDLGVRKVSIVQSNSFALETFKEVDGKQVASNSWCDFPKAKQLQADGSNKVVILRENGEPMLTYIFLED